MEITELRRRAAGFNLDDHLVALINCALHTLRTALPSAVRPEVMATMRRSTQTRRRSYA